MHRVECLALLIGEGAGSSSTGTSSRGFGEADIRAFGDQISFEQGEGSGDVEEQASGWGGGVDGLGQRPESDALSGELFDELDEVRQGAAESVESSKR